jgi:tRNA A37 N6-isopentenylltransferase MiaA
VVEWLELDGRDYAALSKSIAVVSRQYAKRQLTWFRGQTDFDWLEADSAARLPWL